MTNQPFSVQTKNHTLHFLTADRGLISNQNSQENLKKPVILQILPGLESGGVERGTIDIAKALKLNSFEPIIASSGGILTYELREKKIKHFDIKIGSKNPFYMLSNYKKLVEIIETNKVDLVHARSRIPMLLAYFACKKTKTKLVSTVHGTYSLNFLFWTVFPLKKLYNSIMLRADSVIAVSNHIKNYIRVNYPEFGNNSINVIQRGVDLQHFDAKNVSRNRIIDLIKNWNLPEDKKIILMPARFTAWKGHEFLIEALAKVKNDFFCVMAGSDHGHKGFRKKIEQKIFKENLSEKVRIIGVCKDMSVAYQTSYFVVSPSIKAEAFGRIAIEAQASRKPVIATNIGGSTETIIDKQTGFLVSPWDVDHLASLIDDLLSMPKEKIEEIGNKGRKNVEESFSNEIMCSKTLDIYRQALSS